MRPDAAAILVAAGSGARLGLGIPKALAPLGGVPLVRHAARTLAGLDRVGLLIVVTPPGRDAVAVEAAAGELGVEIRAVEGGARRRDSVAAGLAAAPGWPLVLVHDAARPAASAALAARVLEAAASDGAAVPALPVADTLVREREGAVGEVVDRDGVRAVQTPQAFRRELLERAHRDAPAEWDAPDDGSMVLRVGGKVSVIDGEPENIKVTWPSDVGRAEAIMRIDAGSSRVGLGWDVHPIVPGRRFPLVGVIVSEEEGPAGHSDGDPLAHAVADALLGAAAAGDIGQLFPDDDPVNEGLPGVDLLAATVEKLAGLGWRPLQVDAVLITDRPKIAPNREAIREALAEVLGLEPDAVSVKGKRTEGLGSLAGGAGVCCQAVARIGRL